jgi:NADH dehydrogenase
MSAREPRRIVILGGGFGGVYAALELAKRFRGSTDVQITLVNRENFFLFTPMLHEVAASDLDLTHIVNPLRKLLRGVHLFHGDAEAIDLRARSVRVSHGHEHHSHDLFYDHLVLALGSITNFFGLPGLAERAVTMKSLGDAIHLRNRLIAGLYRPDSVT